MESIAKCRTEIILSIIGLVILLFLFIGIPVIYSEYNVWSAGKAGEAELKQADWNRQIIVREAQAKQEAAIALAAAEVERAKGVAQANQIIGKSLENNEAYLRYLWINGLNDGKNQVIYVPTEANLPILEANRLNHIRDLKK